MRKEKQGMPTQPSLLTLVRQPWSPWAKRIALLLSGQWISLLGSAVVQFAILWYIQRSTDSGAMLAVGVICSFLPQALLAPYAAVWARRFGYKKLIVWADICIAMATLTMAAIFSEGRGNLGWLFVLSVIRGAGAGLQAPAVNSLLPQLTPEEYQSRIGGLVGSAQSFAALIPPIISAWLLSATALSNIFFLDVVTATVGIALLLLIKLPVLRKEAAAAHPWRELFESLRYIRSDRPAGITLGFFTLITLLLVPVSMLSPLLTLRLYGADYWLLTQLEIVYGVGAMLGGAWIAGSRMRNSYTRAMTVSAITLGVLTALLGLPLRFYLFLAVMTAIGAWVSLFSGSCITLLEGKANPDSVPGVIILQQTAATLCFPVGIAIFGLVADWLSIRTIFTFTGIAIIATGFWMTRFWAVFNKDDERHADR